MASGTEFPFSPGDRTATRFLRTARSPQMGDLARHPQKIGPATFVKDVF
jgi:hypothetical protein